MPRRLRRYGTRDSLVGGWVDRLAGWWVGLVGLAGWWVGCLVVGLVGYWIGWLVGWLVGPSNTQYPARDPYACGCPPSTRRLHTNRLGTMYTLPVTLHSFCLAHVLRCYFQT